MLFSVEQAFVVREKDELPLKPLRRNLEPLLKGCLAATTTKKALYVSKEVKENAQSHQRSNPAGQEQKPQKINKNVCVTKATL